MGTLTAHPKGWHTLKAAVKGLDLDSKPRERMVKIELMKEKCSFPVAHLFPCTYVSSFQVSHQSSTSGEFPISTPRNAHPTHIPSWDDTEPAAGSFQDVWCCHGKVIPKIFLGTGGGKELEQRARPWGVCLPPPPLNTVFRELI